MADTRPAIRPLALSDSAALLAWRNDPTAYRWFRDSRPLSAEEHENWMAARVADEPPTVWVAEIDGAAVGCVRLDSEADGSAEVSIVVDADRRGSGIGAALLDHCRSEARRRRVDTVRAEVNADNVASLALFTRHGFEVTGRDGDFVLLRLA